MGWFESQSAKERKTTIMNVIAVMLADGKITDAERTFLNLVASRVGIKDKELKAILANPKKVKFTPAKDPQERTKQLIDAVYMMLIDGNIDQREMALCVSIAVQLGFQPAAINRIIQDVVEKIKQGMNRQQVSVDIEGFLKG